VDGAPLPRGLAAVLAVAAALTGYSMVATWLGPVPGSVLVDRYLVAPLQLNPNLNLLGTALLMVAGGAAAAAALLGRLARPWLVTAVQVTACSVTLSAATGGALGTGAGATVAGTLAASAPAFVIGQVVWCVHAGRTPLWAGVGIGLAAWIVLCSGQRAGFDLGQHSNALTLAIAAAIVAIALLAGNPSGNPTGRSATPSGGLPNSPAAATVRHGNGNPARGRFAFLDLFRGIAAPLVVYSHVVTMWLVPNDLDGSAVVRALDTAFREPLKLEQHMGHLAVVMFFLVSGFIVTHVGTQESRREFGVKRFLRIYPLLAAAVLISAAVGLLGMQVLNTGQRYELTTASVLTNMLLANYFVVPQIVLVGVAWTLVIEVVFYTTVLLLLPLLRRSTALAITVELSFVLVVTLLARELGDSFFLFAVSVSFLPVVLAGQIVWAVWSNRIPLPAGAVFCAAGWLLYVWAGDRSMGRIDGAYCSTFALGFLLFLVGLLAERRLRRNGVVSYFADRSYSIYLLHGLLAFPVVQALHPGLPAPLSLLAGLGLTLAAAELTYRFVEVPGQRLARRLTGRPPRQLTRRLTGRPPRQLTGRLARRHRPGRASKGGAHRASAARPSFVGRAR